MSDAFNQKATGWSALEPKGGVYGKYSKYSNQLVVIVAPRNKRGRHDGIVIYLTDAVMNFLKRPDRLLIMTRGSIVRLANASAVDTSSYKVMQSKDNGEVHGMSFVNLTTFGKVYRIDEGVYDTYTEGEVLVFDTFDTQSPPSRP